MSKKLMAIMMSAMLACALCPGLAVAAPLKAGTADSTQTLGTQAKTTAYVLTKVTMNKDDSQGGFQAGKFGYHKNYLLKKVAYNNSTPITYQYNGTNLSQLKQGTSKTRLSTTGKDGKIKKATWTMPNASTKSIVDKMTYKSGRVASYTETLTPMPGFGKGYVDKRTFTYSNGKVSKKTLKGRWSNETETYKYDDKGNLIDKKTVIKYKGGSNTSQFTIENTYDANENLSKRTVSNKESSEYENETTYTYHYKKVQVDKSVASKIEAQQWALANLNLNFAIGIGTQLMY